MIPRASDTSNMDRFRGKSQHLAPNGPLKQFGSRVTKINRFKSDIDSLIEDNKQSMSFFNQLMNKQKSNLGEARSLDANKKHSMRSRQETRKPQEVTKMDDE